MNRKSFLPQGKRIFAAAIAVLCAAMLCAEKISFSAGSMKGTVGDKSDVTELSGGAYVLTESMEISADSIKMSGKDFRFIEAEGSVKGKNSEAELEFECGSLKYDRETKVAELFDSVSLTDVKNNVTATAQMIEYNQTSDIAVMQMEIELKQKDNVCKGAYAVYRKKDQMLELSGNAQIKQGDDSFRAQEIILNLDSQEITLDGRVKGSVVDERKTEQQDEDTESVDGAVKDVPEEAAEIKSGTGEQNGMKDEKSDATKEISATNGDALKADNGINADSDKQSGEKEIPSAVSEKTADAETSSSENRKSSKSKRGKK